MHPQGQLEHVRHQVPDDVRSGAAELFEDSDGKPAVGGAGRAGSKSPPWLPGRIALEEPPPCLDVRGFGAHQLMPI